MRLQHMFLRSVAQFSSKPPWIHRSYSSGNTEFSIPCEVLSILSNAKPIEPALDPLLPFLSPKIIASVIKEQRNRQVGFRFFFWASKRERLRSRESLRLVIDMLSEDNGCDLYWQTLEELKRVGVSVDSYYFFVLISAYSKMGMTEKAVESFGRMNEFDCKPDVLTYNVILQVMKQNKFFLLALAVYTDMLKCNCSPNQYTYSIMMDILSKEGMIDDALKMFDEMTHRGILPNRVIYTIVFQGLCQMKRADEALRLFHKMKEGGGGSSLDSVAHNALLDGFCKLHRIDEAIALLRMFEKDGFVLDLRRYSSLIDGFFRAKRYAEAFELYEKMLEENIKPDIVLYTILIQGLCKAGKVKDAMELLRDMPRRGIVPDTHCYNAVIWGLCEEGLLEPAQSLQLEITENGCFPDACTYTILICGMSKNGLVSKAEEIFNEMEQKGCYPSVFTFNALIDGLCKSGKLNKALSLFHKMEVEVGKHPSLFLRLSQGGNWGQDRSILKSMIERYCESGMILEAYKILMQLAETRNPDIVTYNILINAYCKAGNIDGALKLIVELKGKGLSPDRVTYGTLINGLMRAGREKDAFVLFDRNSGTHSPSVYRTLMTWSCRKRQVSVAFNLWSKYLRETTKVENEEVKDIEQCFEEGDLERSSEGLIQLDIRLKEFGLGPYTLWLIGLCQSGKFKEAMKVFYVLRESKIIVTPPSCVKLIHGLCKRGELDAAIEVFSYSLANGFKLMPRVCDYLLRSLLLSKDKKEFAFELMQRMKLVGYDVGSLLRAKTKRILHGYKGKRVKSLSHGHEDTVETENVSPG